jgi:hypothetical protein
VKESDVEHVGEVGCLVAPRSLDIDDNTEVMITWRVHPQSKTTRHWPLSRGIGKHSDSMFVFSIRSSYVALVVGLSNIYDLQALWKSRCWYIVGKLCALFVCN